MFQIKGGNMGSVLENSLCTASSHKSRRIVSTQNTENDSTSMAEYNGFSVGDYVVYRTHGVGKITDINKVKTKGYSVGVKNHFDTCLVVKFERENMSILVPIDQLNNGDIRPLGTKVHMTEVLSILKNGAKKIKGMWNRRAKEYEMKINSGDIKQIAEVLRDLTRAIDDTERSYSERVIYETTIARISLEYSYVMGMTYEAARDKILEVARKKVVFSDSNQGIKEEA